MTPTKQRFLLLQVISPQYPVHLALENMKELELLVDTYGGEVVTKTIQHRVKPDNSTYVGKGKLEEIKTIVKDEHIDVIVLNDIVNAGQIFRLEQELWDVNLKIMIWDRVDLILNIFDQHASTREAQLQIQLARIHHLGPRIYGLGRTLLSRQGGGIGTRGGGETNIELERRNIKKVKQKIQQELKMRMAEQDKRIAQRKTRGLKTVALVGYTSAGKTTLFNALTRKERQTNQSLFTTLDSVVGKLNDKGEETNILISDTIGFIENLPPYLIDAFRSTLAESLAAQVVLHIVDAADSHREEKIKVVELILDELGIEEKPILVFNKVDLLNKKQQLEIENLHQDRQWLFISAMQELGLEELKSELRQQLS